MDSWTDGKTDLLANRQTGEQIEKQTDEQPKKFMNRQTDWQIDGWTDGKAKDSQMDRHIGTLNELIFSYINFEL